jgi:hypothetical protein
VQGRLSNKKALLKLAFLSLTKSVRNDPDKFSSLIYYDTAAYYNRSSFTDEQQRQPYSSKDSFKQAYIDMLLEETEKLHTSLVKDIVGESISEYVSNTTNIIRTIFRHK